MDPALSASQARTAAHDTTHEALEQAVQGKAVQGRAVQVGEPTQGGAAVNVAAMSASIWEQPQAAPPAELPRQPAVIAESGTDR